MGGSVEKRRGREALKGLLGVKKQGPVGGEGNKWWGGNHASYTGGGGGATQGQTYFCCVFL